MVKSIGHFVIAFVCCLVSHNGYGDTDSRIRQNVFQVAQGFIGIEEATGQNDGEPYHIFMKPYGYPKVPWCALAIKKTLDDGQVNTNGINGTAISCVSKNRTYSTDSMVVWWKDRVGGTGHVGFILSWPKYGDHFQSIEGNYRNGYRLVRRLKKVVKKKADWIGKMSKDQKEEIEKVIIESRPEVKNTLAPELKKRPIPIPDEEKKELRIGLLMISVVSYVAYWLIGLKKD